MGKGVPEGCILSPGLFNLYAEYIMRNAGLEEVSFHSIPKKSNAKEYSNNRTITLISYTSKVMLKILPRQALAINEP